MTQTPLTATGQLGRAEEHPGFGDPLDRRRRDAIVALAVGHAVGAPSPHISYSGAEHATWRSVHSSLTGAWQGRVCRRWRTRGGGRPSRTIMGPSMRRSETGCTS
ncbi:hypothetical protein ACIRP0_27510 [Streptomyces sp. NPDC101733]|uniref:hypothetical protein n=1 Tax=unclassified Streptomyces TaxID=2593676 RepID=UPI00381659C7